MTTLSTDSVDAPDLTKIFLYADGSKSAADQLEQNLQAIRARQALLNLQLDFIAKHSAALAGLYWQVDAIDPEISIASNSSVRAVLHNTPVEIAHRWPDAKWRRQKQKYGDEYLRDWVTTVDAMTVKILRAERYEPNPCPPDGPITIPPAAIVAD